MLLLGLKHTKQQHEADCMVACCAMVLDYLHIPVRYQRLLHLLETQEFGTFFSRVHNLTKVGVSVRSGEYARLTLFEQIIDLGLPIIVPVRTWTLLYWQGIDTEHALVIVGVDLANEKVYVYDPFFTEAPIELSLDEFEPAWTEMDRRYAVISLSDINK